MYVPNLLYVIALTSLSALVEGHSWIDFIYPTSDPTSKGYPRGYQGHDVSTSITQYKVLSRDPTTPLCGPSQQDNTAYTSTYPLLKIAAGASVTGQYLENGHVTKDKLAPDNLPHPGNYSWYWSRSGDMKVFGDATPDKVIAQGNFDDGKCAVDSAGIQGRPGPIPCLSTFTIPERLQV